MKSHQLTSGAAVFHGDNRDVLKLWPADSFDSIVTDPPYALVSIQKRYGKGDARTSASLAAYGSQGVSPYMRAASGFMNQNWDTGEVAFSVEFWAEILRVLKPGGHLVAFGSSRGYHRLACAIEDAGFEIRDSLMYLYGTGFPKSHNVGKGIDEHLFGEWLDADPARRDLYRDDCRTAKAHSAEALRQCEARWREAGGFAREVVGESSTRLQLQSHKEQSHGGWNGQERTESGGVPITAAATPEAAEWEGWGTALKPGFEPIVLARKPLSEGTVAANVLRWGTGALNIDACRVPSEARPVMVRTETVVAASCMSGTSTGATSSGEMTTQGRHPANVVHDGSAEVVGAFPYADKGGKFSRSGTRAMRDNPVYGKPNTTRNAPDNYGDSGSAARFFYSAKASRADRAGSKHPTVKPVSLKQWLCRMVTPPGGLVLDPFAGSGTTGQAATLEGFRCVLIEREAQFVEDIRQRFASPSIAPTGDENSSATVRIDVDSTSSA